MNQPPDWKFVRREVEFSEDENNLAKKLAQFWKEERERQGIPYAKWEDMAGDIKACFLNQARQLLIIEGFDIDKGN